VIKLASGTLHPHTGGQHRVSAMSCVKNTRRLIGGGQRILQLGEVRPVGFGISSVSMMK
jgi:hypothetical protein